MKIEKLTIQKCLFKINIEKMRFTCLDDMYRSIWFFLYKNYTYKTNDIVTYIVWGEFGVNF